MLLQESVLIFLWRSVVQSGVGALSIMERHIFIYLFSQFRLRVVSVAVELLLLEHGEERLHGSVIMGRSSFRKRLRDLQLL
jgi:hypothetical protein